MVGTRNMIRVRRGVRIGPLVWVSTVLVRVAVVRWVVRIRPLVRVSAVLIRVAVLQSREDWFFLVIVDFLWLPVENRRGQEGQELVEFDSSTDAKPFRAKLDATYLGLFLRTERNCGGGCQDPKRQGKLHGCSRSCLRGDNRFKN